MSEEMDFAQLVAQEDEIKLLEAENKRLREALEAVQAGKGKRACVAHTSMAKRRPIGRSAALIREFRIASGASDC